MSQVEKHLTNLLESVRPNRRDLLKRLLVGGGVLAVLAPASTLLAAEEGQEPGGQGSGKGKGKGKGKGGGKGKGTGPSPS